jgi:hypothetical protein
MIKVKEIKQEYAEFYLSVDQKYFPIDFQTEAFENDKLILKFNLFCNEDDIISLNGEIALGMIPLDFNIDGFWEADRPAGTWDWYTVFKFSTKVNNDLKNLYTLQIYNAPRSFLDLDPYKIQFEFDLKNYDINEMFFENEIDEEENYFEFIVNQLMKIFSKEFNAELIEKPKDNI